VNALRTPLPRVHGISRQFCQQLGLNLVAPGDPLYDEARVIVVRGYEFINNAAFRPALDEAARARVAARVSFTLPGVGVAGLLRMVPQVGTLLATLVADVGAARPTIVIAPDVWGDARTLVRVLAHEVGHGLVLNRVSHSNGDPGELGALIATALWCLSYGSVPWFRAWSEACEKTADVEGEVIINGTDVDVAVASEIQAMQFYGVTAPADFDPAARVIRSCGESLRVGQLHGLGTPMHALLHALRVEGEDFGPWNGVIDGYYH